MGESGQRLMAKPRQTWFQHNLLQVRILQPPKAQEARKVWTRNNVASSPDQGALPEYFGLMPRRGVVNVRLHRLAFFGSRDPAAPLESVLSTELPKWGSVVVL